MIQSKRNQFLVPNLVAFISQNEKNVWFFDYHLLIITCSVRKMVLICLMQNIDMCLLHKSHQIASLVSHLINHFPNECLPCNIKMLLNLVANMKFCTSFYIIKWLLMAIYIVYSCRISFNLNCIIKQFYNIATKVSSRKKCYYFWWSTWLLKRFWRQVDGPWH